MKFKYFQHSHLDLFIFLLRYLHDRETNPETLENLAKICPDIQSCYLDTPKEETLTKLSKAFPKLDKVKFSKVTVSNLEIFLKLRHQNESVRYHKHFKT